MRFEASIQSFAAPCAIIVAPSVAHGFRFNANVTDGFDISFSEDVASMLGQQRAVIILWDDSYSMGYQQNGAAGNGATAFERAKRLLADYIHRLNAGDKVVLIRASTGGPSQSVADKPTPDRQAVVSQIYAAKLTDCATDLPAAFDRAREVLAELPKRIHEWMPRLSQEGIVGADAIFACLGPALEVFSRYARVEKASGEQVSLREYLEQVWAAVWRRFRGEIGRRG